MQQIDLNQLGKYVDAVNDIQSKWMLVTSQADGKVNTLTASWGGLGSLWRKKVAFIFIRPSRYTNQFLEKSHRFTLTFFDGHMEEMGYLGKTSGRDVPDKIEKAEGPAYEALYSALHTICRDLAMQMAGDGEGCTKLIEVTVQGMDTLEHARTLAKSVITSSLTKAAVYGSDANWGRILCALGYAGVDFDPGDLQLYFIDEEKGGDDPQGRMLIFTDGAGADFSEEEATKLLKREKVTLLAQFHMGEETATAWGCDLTHDYVSINADYRS